MNRIKKGDIVARISYGMDIIFEVKNIIKIPNKTIVILKGVIERIEADCEIEDLQLIDKNIVNENLKRIDEQLESINQKTKENRDTSNQEKIITGKILHLDGDRRYSEKSYRYYQQTGLNAVVKNIPEYRQPRVLYQLLERYEPDILIVTGHDRYDIKR